MENQVISRKEIMVQAEKLAKLIAVSEEVDFFKRAEQQIKQNDKVQKLINDIKKQQKHAVQFEHYDKAQALKGTKTSLDALHEEIDSIPVVQEFKRSQKDVNDLLQLVTNIISNTVTNEIIESTGGDVLKGVTGGGNSGPSCPF